MIQIVFPKGFLVMAVDKAKPEGGAIGTFELDDSVAAKKIDCPGGVNVSLLHKYINSLRKQVFI